LVLLELDVTEAETANWRAGFYKVAFSPVEVWEKLGQPLEAGQHLASTSGRKKRQTKAVDET
jgi:hypothetical protein